MTNEIDEYKRRYDAHLQVIAENLRLLVSGHTGAAEHIDRVVSRAKSPERFADKARAATEDERAKYQSPLIEIQDQLGVRIIVFYRDDVEVVAEKVLRYFQPIETKRIVPDSEWEFGYFGQHFILPVPRDAVPKEVSTDEVPAFFELQIKTLFQHAWSEANHDLGYKPTSPLSSDQKRLLAFTAAQAWGADRVFSELWNEVNLTR